MQVEPSDIAALVGDDYFKQWRSERKRLDRIDNWYRWEHDKPHSPRSATREYKELAGRAQAPWGGLVVTSLAQQMFVEGYGAADVTPTAWEAWLANDMDARQIPLHRATFAYGLAYELLLPGKTKKGKKMPSIRPASPRRMMAFYEDPANDEWPEVALDVDYRGSKRGWKVQLIDDNSVHHLTISSDGRDIIHKSSDDHEVGYVPVVRFANVLDLEGRADGEIEPFIPVLACIDQTKFDRLVVQRFSAYVVRTIAGMAQPEGDAEALKLKIGDLLVATDPDAKFGSLPATSLDGFIAAHENDVKTLAALTQTPAHELLGQMANLSAEALAAAEASLTRKVTERKHTMGGSHNRSLRLCAELMGDDAGAEDFASVVRWKDMESRSLSQAADALGKLATLLDVPVELLWTKIPGFTDQDVAEARRLLKEQGGIAQLVQELVDAQTGGQQEDPPPPPAA